MRLLRPAYTLSTAMSQNITSKICPNPFRTTQVKGPISPGSAQTGLAAAPDNLESSNKKHRVDPSQMTKPVRVGALCAANIVRKTARGISLADGVGEAWARGIAPASSAMSLCCLAAAATHEHRAATALCPCPCRAGGHRVPLTGEG